VSQIATDALGVSLGASASSCQKGGFSGRPGSLGTSAFPMRTTPRSSGSLFEMARFSGPVTGRIVESTAPAPETADMHDDFGKLPVQIEAHGPWVDELVAKGMRSLNALQVTLLVKRY
jgi:hypothetical protein